MSNVRFVIDIVDGGGNFIGGIAIVVGCGGCAQWRKGRMCDFYCYCCSCFSFYTIIVGGSR